MIQQNDHALKSCKEKAMSRQRKVIFDSDGSDTDLSNGTTDQDLIDVRAKPAIDAGIDTYIYTTGQCFGLGKHDSRVGSVLKIREGHLSGNKTADFIRNGSDCLRIVSEYVRKSGKEFFWGMRMNDTHDAAYGGVFLPNNQFKKENPDVMFGKNAKYGTATAVDYLDERVRNFALTYIMDVVDRYDIDGICLDFYRHPFFFRSTAQGLPVTKEETAAMNSFMRNVKEELDKRRSKHGKYYLVAVRVPDSVEYCRGIGLDIETWLADELADLLFTSGYLQLNHWEYSAKLGHKYGVPVYPSLDESRVKSEFSRHKRNCIRGYYGRVMNVWESGCDGVFMFNNSGLRETGISIELNWFAKDAGNFQEALDATVKGKEYVNGLSKTYFVSFRGGWLGAFPYQDFLNMSILNHQTPLIVGKSKPKDVPILISDDFDAAAVQRKTPKATANIFILGNPDALTVIMNRNPLNIKVSVNNQTTNLKGNEKEYVLSADIPVRMIKKGQNVFSFETEQEITLLDLWVDIDYP